MKTKSLRMLGALLCLSLAGCNAAPKITGYSIDDQNNVMVVYDNGTTENVGKLTDADITSHISSITISNDGYFVVNGIKTNTKVDYGNIAISADGYYVIGGVKTGIAVSYESVTISDDGFYVINGVKTGIRATNVYTVTFSTGTAASVPEQKVQEGKKVERPEVERPGYELVGWFCNGEEWRFNSDVVLNDMTLTAEWSANEYTISFDSKGGTEFEPIKVHSGESYVLPTPTKDLYDFKSWELGGKAVQSGVFDFAKDIVLEAVWERTTYTISFDSNGGSSVSAIKVPSYSTVDSLPAPSRTDYEFVGWHLNEELVETPFEFTEGNITLVAKWHAVSSDYEFVENEQGTISVKECKLDQEIVSVPSSFSGKAVTEILTGAFKGKQNVKEINLPASITSVGYKAIENCTNLETLTLCGHSDIELSYVFGSEGLIPASLKTIKIAKGSTTYGKALFDNLSSRNFVLYLNDDVKTVPSKAFEYCDRISKLFIPEGVQTIGDLAIASLDNLTYVNIPSTVRTIGQSNFINCERLVYLAVPHGITSVASQGLCATEIPVLIAEQSMPSGWSSLTFGYSVTQQYMKVFWGLERIVDGDDFLYGLCKVGNKKQAVIIQRYSPLAEYPEYLEDYPVSYTNNDYTAPRN